MAPFKRMEYDDDRLKIKYEPTQKAIPEQRNYLTLIEEIERGGPLPHLIMSSLDVGGHYEGFPAIT
jgi:hypothetical protein